MSTNRIPQQTKVKWNARKIFNRERSEKIQKRVMAEATSQLERLRRLGKWSS